ncbi:MAG: WYL domain-containing protein, partial [Solirubrobacterales bacterium]|nr:WYL domain-containing protein [Solirubrobacterales bacterium]
MAAPAATGVRRVLRLPPLLLDDEEAVALMVGMRAAASAAVQGIEDASLRALVKLDQVLSARLRRRVRAFDVLSSPAADVVEPALVAALTAAIGRRERIELRYRDREGARTRRLVDPHRVIAVHRRWYLLAFDTGHEDWRTFRVDRIERIADTAVLVGQQTAPADPVEFVTSRLYSLDDLRSRPGHDKHSRTSASPTRIIRSQGQAP